MKINVKYLPNYTKLMWFEILEAHETWSKKKEVFNTGMVYKKYKDFSHENKEI